MIPSADAAARLPRVLADWVDECARMMSPERVHWCDGSDQEYAALLAEMVQQGTLLELDQAKYPGGYLHRSHPSDVARSEQVTFICTEKQDDAGPTNKWMSPAQAEERVAPLFRGCMKGRTLYVVPYLMGPVGSPFAKPGIQITDSAYVAANLRIMTRMGRAALEAMGDGRDVVRGAHSLGDLSPEHRFVCHFPERRLIWSIGSGYGGNALLSKKCFALRIAGTMARREGWLAEHMLILGLESPEGDVTYMAAAFPSACGKTNLAMLVPPPSQRGWKVWTVGDDIAWMHWGPEGRLYAINPEAGFFAVAPGTSRKTNPNMTETIRRNTIFTNVALAPDRTPWWEGMDGPVPDRLEDWRGLPWVPGTVAAAHPNSRFTAPAAQCPSISPRWNDPGGVPISAIIFGGRRSGGMPLVAESLSWNHGVFLGATLSSETTAAAQGAVGVLRQDPMAMRPFCGYNMADYFGHWLRMGTGKDHRLPCIFQVNWFRKGPDGRFLWPGFGENVRVLRWIRGRCRGEAPASQSPLGLLPTPSSLDVTGLDLSKQSLRALFSIDHPEWNRELESQREFLGSFGSRLPGELWEEHRRLFYRLSLDHVLDDEST